ncbi:hypothetical protein SAMN05443252_107249 [Bacillus sp. OV322]|nr:hypothetical protein SAMN05443252_107249 [Bacillus sp. OV322]
MPNTDSGSADMAKWQNETKKKAGKYVLQRS